MWDKQIPKLVKYPYDYICGKKWSKTSVLVLKAEKFSYFIKKLSKKKLFRDLFVYLQL